MKTELRDQLSDFQQELSFHLIAVESLVETNIGNDELLMGLRHRRLALLTELKGLSTKLVLKE